MILPVSITPGEEVKPFRSFFPSRFDDAVSPHVPTRNLMVVVVAILIGSIHTRLLSDLRDSSNWIMMISRYRLESLEPRATEPIAR